MSKIQYEGDLEWVEYEYLSCVAYGMAEVSPARVMTTLALGLLPLVGDSRVVLDLLLNNDEVHDIQRRGLRVIHRESKDWYEGEYCKIAGPLSAIAELDLLAKPRAHVMRLLKDRRGAVSRDWDYLWDAAWCPARPGAPEDGDGCLKLHIRASMFLDGPDKVPEYLGVFLEALDTCDTWFHGIVECGQYFETECGRYYNLSDGMPVVWDRALAREIWRSHRDARISRTFGVHWGNLLSKKVFECLGGEAFLHDFRAAAIQTACVDRTIVRRMTNGGVFLSLSETPLHSLWGKGGPDRWAIRLGVWLHERYRAAGVLL